MSNSSTLTVQELVMALREKNIYIAVDGDALKVQAPKGAMTPEISQAIRAHKPTLLTYFKDKSPLVVINQGNPARPNFFCVHGAGGNVIFLNQWIKHLGSQPFYALESPGVDGRLDLPGSIQEMAAVYLKEIQTVQPRGPYFIGGYSVGGLIALEIAKQIEQIGEEVRLLVLFDTFHPSIEPRKHTNMERIYHIVTEPVEFTQNVIQKRVIDPKKYADYHEKLQGYLERRETLPIELRQQYMEDHIESILYDYEITSYLGSTLMICAAKVWSSYSHAGRDRGWQRTIPNLRIHEVPCNHHDLISDPYAGMAVDSLISHIDTYSTDLRGL